ncbi:hypothetical protein [Sulfitobacter sp. R18_1]|uniref:hypothetical protein n=1 Tax=Sulfitobacter sp. R18_1 TaxID=2821104 RepID=UPI001AD9B551|nr:hypothetical protein [Sulfitobacter sp. R18_1]MBO9430601.1 hypothetical protein [Sulfitobacter sp. R18_1]
MTRDQEYGPWIDHDGRGCPCKGKIVETDVLGIGISEHVAFEVFLDLNGRQVVPKNAHLVRDAWTWTRPRHGDVIRYRVRKPDALRALIQMVESIGTPAQPERVEA